MDLTAYLKGLATFWKAKEEITEPSKNMEATSLSNVSPAPFGIHRSLKSLEAEEEHDSFMSTSSPF